MLFANPETLFQVEPEIHFLSAQDMGEDFLQVIPYITLINRDTKEIFVYNRGQAIGGSDQRPDASIGLSSAMTTRYDVTTPFMSAVAAQVVRILHKDVGLRSDPEILRTVVTKLIDANYGLVYHKLGSTSHHRLGISLMLPVAPSMVDVVNPSEVSDGRWMCARDLSHQHRAGQIKLETMSHVVLDIISQFYQF